MQIGIAICILLLSLFLYYIWGKAVCVRFHWKLGMPETICAGFFLYFAVFQLLAEGMIFTKQKLHVLGYTWLAVLVLLTAAAGAILYLEYKRRRWPGIGKAGEKAEGHGRPDTICRLALLLMGAAVVCECIVAVLLQRNIGWDFAYYIGNMATSVSTDTMYLYEGSSGLLRETVEMRYALSSFYMNTAWIGQMTGVSVLVLQKYMVGIQCILLANAIVYSFAMEVFRGDKKKTAVLVTLTIVLTIFWDVYDTSAQFLMLRNYEAKAYCANVVLPMVVYLLYRLWKNISDAKNWGELFLVSFASVAVSMSSLLLVPALIVLMLLAHMIVDRQLAAGTISRAVCCLLPNVCYLLVYFMFNSGVLALEV